MLLWASDFRAVFWVAVIPGALAVLLLVVGVREPEPAPREASGSPIRRDALRRLGTVYWGVVAVGAVFTQTRFSEAFLVLRASVMAGLLWDRFGSQATFIAGGAFAALTLLGLLARRRWGARPT